MTTLEAAWRDHLRPREPDAPTVISTFAGCGGSSLGYSMAGFRELLAVEWDDNAVATFRLNFPEVPIYHGDIAKLSVEECLNRAGIKPGELDVLDGSPPCQGFSTAGKRQIDDPRNSLFWEYVRLLRGLQPRAFVMENVSGMVKGKMKLVFAEILRELKASGYTVKARLLNAMYFGVPQSRQRIIFIGIREDLGIEPSHPKATSHLITLKDAFQGIVAQGRKSSKFSLLKSKRWQETLPGSNHKLRFSLSRHAWNRVAFTVQKTSSGSAGSTHPDEPREFHEAELKRIGNYPDSYLFVGSWTEVLARIGNSVPPFFMKAIARQIRETLSA